MDKRWTFFSADFELSAHCSMRCGFCPRERLTRTRGHMDLDHFHDVAERLAALHVRLTFCGMGNPTLNPHWREFIKIYRRLGGFCGIVIHVGELNDSLLHGLMDSGPNVVEISCPSVDPDVFERICPTVSFSEAMKQAEKLIMHPHRRFAVVPIGVRTKLNPDEPRASARLWKELGVTARVNRVHSRGGNLTDDHLCDVGSAGLEKTCGLLAMHAFVAWNGDLLACCHDLTGVSVLGNVFTDDWDDLMERKKGMLGKIPHFDGCRVCTDDYRLGPIPDGPFPDTKSARKRALKRLSRKT